MPTPASPVVVGIYPRKSRFSENSESVATQITLCQEHVQRLYPGCTTIVYDGDEGYSGKNTNRPGFQRMMEDVRQHRITVLCCYRLDRIGRSVRDFCATLDTLQHHGVSFVSVRESFDTASPMGRAMLYIASVFSQLERETIAERIRDALHEAAKSGRWLGGQTPTGYTSKTVRFERGGITRGYCVLAPVDQELEQVALLFEKFATLGSLSALHTYCLQHGIRSKNGVEYSRTTLRAILANPVYCTADSDAWAYFSTHDYALAADQEDFDGQHGLMPYNRTAKTDTLTISKPTTEWIISVGAHPGCVSGALWVKAQQIFVQNKDKGAAWRGRRTETALLSGIIRCGQCGSAMRPRAYGQPLPDGSRRVAYICTRKIDSRGHLCQMTNAPAHVIDPMLIEQLHTMSAQYDDLASGGAALLSGSASKASDDAIRRLESDIRHAQQQFDNLMGTLADGAPEAVRRQIYQRMDALTAAIEEKRADIARITADQFNAADQVTTLQQLAGLFASFGDSFSALTHDEKRRLIQSVISTVVWDGESITINLAGAPASLG